MKKGEKSIEIAQGRGEQEVLFTTSSRLEEARSMPARSSSAERPTRSKRDDERYFVFKLRASAQGAADLRRAV